MYTGEVEIENVTVPAGDPGEQLIANLILALIASELHVDETAKEYVTQAHALSLDLSAHSPIYRPLRPSKFVRLTCEVDSEIQIILLSVINDILVVPAIAAGQFASNHRGYPDAVNVKSLEIVRFMLRLRPRRLATVLESLKGLISRQQRIDAAHRILRSCMHQELPPGEPLDRASDCFSLARDLTGKRNLPLAALALRNADRALDSYMKTNYIKNHPDIVNSMRDQIKGLLNQLKQGAM
jgi:hypothetical protein